MSDGDELAPALARLLGSVWDGEVVVKGWRRLSGGASRQTWSFDALLDDGERRPLVFQRERPGGMRAATGMAVEARVLRAAHAAGVAVPLVVVAQGDPKAEGTDLGDPWLVAERVEGETIARRILRDEDLAGARAGLAAQCGTALAAIHSLDLAVAAGLAAEEPVEQYRTLLDQLGQAHPALELALRWLANHRPTGGSPALVHGDFRNGNLVVGPDGLRAVLDWELAHIGDPLEDLGWLCARAWRFGAEPEVGGFGDRADLVAAYEAAGGRSVDPAALHWWEVMATLRWGVICIVQTTTHLLGLARSVELAAIGRRVCETEHDLAELLGWTDGSGRPDPAEPPAVPAAPTPPHDVPSAAVLVQAVQDFLSTDVRDATEGRVAFHARVAANVLGMVERELTLGPAQAEAHAARLGRLGFADDGGLAAAIRSGALDDRWAEVSAAVAATVADKLAVANPGYAGPGRA